MAKDDTPESPRPDLATTIARFATALDRAQYVAPAQLIAYQRRLLDTLVRHARRETALYADRLAPIFRSDDTIDWDRWTTIPILTRAETQRESAALTARSLPPIAGRATVRESSGSTAEPLRYPMPDIQHLANGCANERVFAWHAIDPAALTAFIWAMDLPQDATYPNGRGPKPWRLGHPESRAVDLVITTPVHQQVEWLRRTAATHFSSYPTNVREVGRLAAEEGRPLKFDAIFTNGEMTTPETRNDIQSLFGREPIDRYGSTEAGLIAASCPETFRHHVIAELVLVEIVNEAGVPAAPGVEGRIVVTPFYGLAMPLIRYDMGDWGAFGAVPCPCGRTLPLLERIYGRSRNMFRFSDGTRIWPVLESPKVQAFVPHRQFQVVQVGPDAVEYRYVPIDPALPIDHAGLTAYARSRLHPSVTITPVAVAAIPRGANGKHEDYISLVADAS